MSAIWGCINLSHNNVDNEILQTLEKPYHKKKIDKFFGHTEDNFCLGAGIQYFVEEAKSEAYPLKSQNAFIVADCILHNRDELVSLLGYSKSPIVDGDLLLLSYEKWGLECVKYLHGLYSFAIYDTAKNEVFLVADHTASRCLYYYYQNNLLFFSTLISPIKAASGLSEINDEYICETLAIPGYRLLHRGDITPYKNLYKVTAGSYVRISASGVTKIQYWTPSHSESLYKKLSTSDLGHTFLSKYKNAVKNSLRSSGEIGVELSSGLDSTSVAGIAAKELLSTGKNLYSYTLVPLPEFTPEAGYWVGDETKGVMYFCSMHDNIVPRFIDSKGTDSINRIDLLVQNFEIPFKAIQNTPASDILYNEAAAQNIKVMLNGGFGNLAVSYGSHGSIIYQLCISFHFREAIRLFYEYSNECHIIKKKYAPVLLKKMLAEPFLKTYTRVPKNELKNSFLDADKASKYHLNHLVRKWGYYEKGRFKSARTYHKLMYDTGMLTYMGEMDTKVSLEKGILLVDPTRDKDIIEFCMNIPYKSFVSNGIERWLIRGNLSEYVPVPLLKDYLHRGDQGADWIYRLHQNESEYVDKLKNVLLSPDISKYISKRKLTTLMSSLEHGLANMYDLDLAYTIYLFTVKSLLNQNY